MKNFLKGLLVILVLAVVCVIGYAGWYYYNNKNTGTSQTDSQQTNIVANQNKNELNKEEEKKEEDVEKEKQENPEKPEEKPEEKVEEKPEEKNEEVSNEEGSLSDEDKAIELAKKQYGMTDGVYFRIEQIQSNGVYIISVRDNETTRDYAWYTVDVRNNTVK